MNLKEARNDNEAMDKCWREFRLYDGSKQDSTREANAGNSKAKRLTTTNHTHDHRSRWLCLSINRGNMSNKIKGNLTLALGLDFKTIDFVITDHANEVSGKEISLESFEQLKNKLRKSIERTCEDHFAVEK